MCEQELERYKTLCVAQEAEIARLKNGFDDLKVFIRNDIFVVEHIRENKVHNDAIRGVLKEINRITGE